MLRPRSPDQRDANRLGSCMVSPSPVIADGRSRGFSSAALLTPPLTRFADWYRAAAWGGEPRPRGWRVGVAVSAVVVLTFAGLLLIMLTRGMYLGNDSAQSYGHVWFIEQALRSGQGIPLHIPNLDSGRALTFPYAAIPWVPSALLRPLLGDWVVTASMVLGVVLLLIGITRWLPRTASPIVMGIVLLNWQLWNSVLQFQLPTIWALALACFAAAQFDRGHSMRAAALASAALIAHPLVSVVGLGITVLAHIESTHRVPFRRAAWLAAAALIASPAIWFFLKTPSMEQIGLWGIFTPAQILLQRSSMLWWPWVVQRSLRWTVRLQAPLLLIGAVLLVRNFAGSNPKNAWWVSLPRFPDYVEAGRVDPGARYRVLTMSNQEDGMVQLMQAGAVLAQSFSDESIQRISFGETTTYRCFLARKGADRVLVNAEWARRGTSRDTSNEVAMLDALVREGHAALVFRGKAGTLDYAITSPVPDHCRAQATPPRTLRHAS